MTEATTDQNTDRQFALQRIYVKDISFETPNSPQIFTQDWRPQVNVNLNTNVTDLGNQHFEVVLTVTVTCKQGEQTAYLAEVHQAGIFMMRGLAEQERGPVMAIYCPNILFPYAREAISDLVTRGSFPPFLLAPVNFEALYAQRTQQQAAAGAPEGSAH